MKKRFLLIAFALIIPLSLFSQENDAPEADELIVQEEEPVREKEDPRLFFTIGPVGMLNTDRQSAPSPIQFSAGFGSTIPLNTWFAFSPSMTLFANYYLWKEGRAYPAEVENRTGIAPSALIELPAVFYAQGKKSTFSFGLGATLFLRYAFLADSVPQSEADSIKSMNSFFYSNLRFFYPSAQLAYDFTTESGAKAGVVLHAWLPLGSLIENRGLDGGMASIAFRLTLAAKAKEEPSAEEAE